MLNNEAGAHSFRRLRLTAGAPLRTPTEALDVLAQVGGSSPRRVGIWEQEGPGAGAGLVRAAAMEAEWHLWADVGRIPARDGGRRVVLLGESAARGYFYDPVATPAGLLAHMLSTSETALEVVDLARTDADLAELSQVVQALGLLEPDAVVLFAGNNWQRLAAEPDELSELTDALRRGGGSAAASALAAQSATRAATVLDLLALQARLRGIPVVVVVVPEFGLGVWHPASTVDPLLTPDDARAWHSALALGRLALAEQRSQDARTAAQRVLELDGGSTNEGWVLLAEAATRLGDDSAVRAALEAARDAPSGRLAPATPRCPRWVQDLLRAKATEHAFALVDLPELLSTNSGARLPDPAAFLDYCHLSWEGIVRTMAEVAARVSRPLLGRPHPPSWFTARAMQPSAEDEATARFLAAIHHSHHGQPVPAVLARCADALRTSPSVAGLMTRYVDFRTRDAPDWICESYREAVMHPSVARYLGAARGYGGAEIGDLALVQVIADALGPGGSDAMVAGIGRNADPRLRPEPSSIARPQHSVHDRAVANPTHSTCQSSAAQVFGSA